MAEIYPDLVARSADGQIETMKYQVLAVMLLNEVQRQQAQSNTQEARIQTLEQQVQERRRELDAQHQQNQLLLERLSKLEAAIAASDHGQYGAGERSRLIIHYRWLSRGLSQAG